MKSKHLSLVAGLAGSLILAQPSDARFRGVNVQVHYASPDSGENLVIYDLYAVFDEPGDRMSAGFGSPDYPLDISVVGGDFYQHPLGGDTAPDEFTVQFVPSLAYDTFVTIGLKVVPDGVTDEMFIYPQPLGFGSDSLASDDLAWMVTPDAVQGNAFNSPYDDGGGPGEVLIGQFSFDANTGATAIEVVMGLQLRERGVFNQYYVSVPDGAVLCVIDEQCEDGDPCNGIGHCFGLTCNTVLGPHNDCNMNAILDACEMDCNGNGRLDDCDMADGTSADCNGNGVPDECDIDEGISADCNGNGLPDDCDIADGLSQDGDGNGIPDECESEPCRIQKILALDGDEDDKFGYAVAINGPLAVIGAPNDSDVYYEAGAAYVFHRDGSVWNEHTKLALPDGAGGTEYLGTAVAVDGDVIAVGVPGNNNENGTWAGAAYVYLWNGSAWENQDVLLAPDGYHFDQLGSSVTVIGSTVLVGAATDSDNGSGSGSVYVFRQNDPTWDYQQKLLAFDGDEFDQFGYSIAADADVAVIGAPFHDGIGADSGSAYVYHRDGIFWFFAQELEAIDAVGGEEYGTSVSVQGDVILVGAPYDDDNGSHSGSVYVYRRDGEFWYTEEKLLAPGGESNDRFGTSVCLNGDVAACGSPGDNYDGAVHLFQYDAQSRAWSPMSELKTPDGSSGNTIGYAVAAHGDMVLAGAPYDDENGNSSGSAYLFPAWPFPDCNDNQVDDACDLAEGTSEDCNGNGIPDECDIEDGTSVDCNTNGVPDDCDIDTGTSEDCNGNGVPDDCDIDDGLVEDCNGNDVPDDCDLDDGTSSDCTGNGVPDECDIDDGIAEDCNGNGVPDDCDLDDGTSVDLNGNGIPDECDLADGPVHNITQPAFYATIQDAIDHASNGDEIVVAPDTYYESIVFQGRAITLRSLLGPDVTIIDGQGSGPVVTCDNGEGSDTVLEGFTITGGGGENGGGMLNSGSSPTIIWCTFADNWNWGGGGGMRNVSANPSVSHCRFVGNGSVSLGGGMYNWSSDPMVVNCVFFDNSVWPPAAGRGGEFRGDGLANDASSPTLINCTFSGNENWDDVGGAIYSKNNSTVVLDNCILWHNGLAPLDGIDSTYVVNYCDVEGGVPGGTGNITDDPLFVDPDNGDLRLTSGSLCIDVGNNAAVPPDVHDLDNDDDTLEPIPVDIGGLLRFYGGDPPVVDMGADEYEPTAIDDVNPDETSTLYPDGSGEPTEDAQVVFTNLSASDTATVVVTESEADAFPDAAGYGVLDVKLVIDTNLEDGYFLMTVIIPFIQEDLDAEGITNPLSPDLKYYDPDTGTWELAVAGNCGNPPDCDGAVGNRFAMTGTGIPPLSENLGDYGVFWNPIDQVGFVWANVDHTTVFAGGFDTCPWDLDGSGLVDVPDFLELLASWGQYGVPADFDGDGVHVTDFLLLLANWGPCP